MCIRDRTNHNAKTWCGTYFRSRLLSMDCWSSKAEILWESQHGLLVVQGSISMACWSSQPSVPQHTHLRAHIRLAFLPFSTCNQTTHGIASSVSHGPHDAGKFGMSRLPFLKPCSWRTFSARSMLCQAFTRTLAASALSCPGGGAAQPDGRRGENPTATRTC